MDCGQPERCCDERCLECVKGTDEYNSTIDRFIAENGFAMLAIFDAPIRFAYTIGLSAKGYPEILLMGGFSMDQFNGILMSVVPCIVKAWDALALADKSLYLKPQKISNCIDINISGSDKLIRSPVLLGKINKNNYDLLIGKALERYENAECLQLMLPDPNGKLPDDDGFDIEWARESNNAYDLRVELIQEEQDENAKNN